MLAAAAATGRPLIPVFILDPETEAFGAAPKWRLGLGVDHFAKELGRVGLQLTLRRGDALSVLKELIAETGAGGVWWGRQYDPAAVKRDTAVKSELKSAGHDAKSFPGHLLFEPWEVETNQGGYYRVYTPFWKAVRGRPVPPATAALKSYASPATWPRSDRLADWQLGAAMNRGAAVVANHVCVGEAAALARLSDFIEHKIDDYSKQRDFPSRDVTSGLSENLAWGEIGPRTIWHEGHRAMIQGRDGAEHFLKELVWREFAYHLMHHTPHITTSNWKSEWDQFPWRQDNPDAEKWRQGMTGQDFVDAGMREMFVTGRMHNRLRMIVGSYLTKHLLIDWRVGLDWFAECLIDWDPASNAMGWQWVAGSGPDAAPYFRIYNPETQAEKFDADQRYRNRFLAEGRGDPDPVAQSYFNAIPRSWKLTLDQPAPKPMIDLSKGRETALAAYGERKS